MLFRASTDGDFTLRFNAYDDAKNAVSVEYKFSDILADADSLINDTVVFMVGNMLLRLVPILMFFRRTV